MSHFNRTTLFIVLIISAGATCFAQTTVVKPQKKVQAGEERQEPSRTDGLKKMTDNANRNRNIDIHIDEEALGNSIEVSIENAMQSVEIALEKMEINIDPIEIHLNDLDIDLEPIEINIPDLDIDIEPIDIDIDFDHFDRDNDWDQDEDGDDNEEEEFTTDEEAIHEESNSAIKSTTQKGKDQLKDQSGKKEKSEKAKTTKDKPKAVKKPN